MLRYRLRTYFTRRKGRLLAAWLICLTLAAAALIGLINVMLDGILAQYVEVRTHALIDHAINQAIADEFAENGEQYNGLVTLQRLDSGQLGAVSTDVVAVNLLKARVALRIGEQLEALSRQNLSVPLGTLLGGKAFLGKGPGISIRLMPLGAASASLASQFTAVGLNQSLHRIVMEVKVAVTVMMPGAAVFYENSQQVVLGETVIVGAVPESYTYLEPLLGNGN